MYIVLLGLIAMLTKELAHKSVFLVSYLKNTLELRLKYGSAQLVTQTQIYTVDYPSAHP